MVSAEKWYLSYIVLSRLCIILHQTLAIYGKQLLIFRQKELISGHTWYQIYTSSFHTQPITWNRTLAIYLLQSIYRRMGYHARNCHNQLNIPIYRYTNGIGTLSPLILEYSRLHSLITGKVFTQNTLVTISMFFLKHLRIKFEYIMIKVVSKNIDVYRNIIYTLTIII